jgi:hypothetical protein
MKTGDLIERITTGRIGIITKVIKMGKDIYYWVYTDDYGKFEHIILASSSIRKL